jgi:hypothetical protein
MLEKSPPPAAEVCAAVYAIAEILAQAPRNEVGYRIMASEALVVELVGRGIPAATAGDAVDWAGGRELLRRVSAPGKYPVVLRDTITLRKVGNGEYAGFLGKAPTAATATAANEPPMDGGKAKMSHYDLAKKYRVDGEALRKRLDRWRYEHDTGYSEVSNAARNEPKYLYDESSVMPVIEDLKAKPVRRKRATDGRQKKI